mmetsp:Transcript_19214/g.46136  ORF Transcript_19214/g.46136 Transcript_19214/m.46136 type:complete len:307 (+) Transcript_19214:818-1738(+)
MTVDEILHVVNDAVDDDPILVRLEPDILEAEYRILLAEQQWYESEHSHEEDGAAHHDAEERDLLAPRLLGILRGSHDALVWDHEREYPREGRPHASLGALGPLPLVLRLGNGLGGVEGSMGEYGGHGPHGFGRPREFGLGDEGGRVREGAGRLRAAEGGRVAVHAGNDLLAAGIMGVRILAPGVLGGAGVGLLAVRHAEVNSPGRVLSVVTVGHETSLAAVAAPVHGLAEVGTTRHGGIANVPVNVRIAPEAPPRGARGAAHLARIGHSQWVKSHARSAVDVGGLAREAVVAVVVRRVHEPGSLPL